MSEHSEIERQMRAWRHHLHAHPETGFDEHATSAFVAETLTSFGLEVQRGIGGTGLVATLRSGGGNRAIGLRGDMDALHILEAGKHDYASKNAGKMHACGHDGHMAMLLGAAKMLSQSPGFDGIVHFVFQPAEEHGRGAKAMLEDGLLKRFPMEEIYGVHNMPGIAFGRFCTRAGGIMASEDNFVIEIKGRGTHAARPHMGVDPIVAGSEIVMALQTVIARSLDPIEQGVVSVTEFLTDGTRNVIPGTVTLKGDTRSYSPKVQAQIEERMGAIVAGICAAHGAQHSFRYTHEFEPTVNWPENVDPALRAATAVVGAANVEGNCPPLLTSEDFGAFLRAIPGNYMLIGSGIEGESGGTPLHNPNYDFNDALLMKGAQYFAALARQRLGAGEA
ncbi:MAG TPA: M20 aminoacylase family protein [Stellaceae bacterium]|nr:M20 aminoacylase family protein [Stellaceae bacterium]